MSELVYCHDVNLNTLSVGQLLCLVSSFCVALSADLIDELFSVKVDNFHCELIIEIALAAFFRIESADAGCHVGSS